ncbi:unnamed protein product [Scytosiphon promiscuus]
MMAPTRRKRTAARADHERQIDEQQQQLQQQPQNGEQLAGENQEGDEEEGGDGSREERQQTIELQRSARGLSEEEMTSIFQQRELRLERRLSLPEKHPRSSSQESYGLTDQEDSESAEEIGERRDRAYSIDVRRTDAAHFAVGGTGPEEESRTPASKEPRRRKSFLFGQSRR